MKCATGGDDGLCTTSTPCTVNYYFYMHCERPVTASCMHLNHSQLPIHTRITSMRPVKRMGQGRKAGNEAGEGNNWGMHQCQIERNLCIIHQCQREESESYATAPVRKTAHTSHVCNHRHGRHWRGAQSLVMCTALHAMHVAASDSLLHATVHISPNLMTTSSSPCLSLYVW